MQKDENKWPLILFDLNGTLIERDKNLTGMWSEARVRPGVVAALRALLAGGFRVGIFSSMQSRNVARAVTLLNLSSATYDSSSVLIDPPSLDSHPSMSPLCSPVNHLNTVSESFEQENIVHEKDSVVPVEPEVPALERLDLEAPDLGGTQQDMSLCLSPLLARDSTARINPKGGDKEQWATVKPLTRHFGAGRLGSILLVDDESQKSAEGEEANLVLVPSWSLDDRWHPVDDVIPRLADSLLQFIGQKRDGPLDLREISGQLSEVAHNAFLKSQETARLMDIIPPCPVYHVPLPPTQAPQKHKRRRIGQVSRRNKKVVLRERTEAAPEEMPGGVPDEQTSGREDPDRVCCKWDESVPSVPAVRWEVCALNTETGEIVSKLQDFSHVLVEFPADTEHPSPSTKAMCRPDASAQTAQDRKHERDQVDNPTPPSGNIHLNCTQPSLSLSRNSLGNSLHSVKPGPPVLRGDGEVSGEVGRESGESTKCAPMVTSDQAKCRVNKRGAKWREGQPYSAASITPAFPPEKLSQIKDPHLLAQILACQREVEDEKLRSHSGAPYPLLSLVELAERVLFFSASCSALHPHPTHLRTLAPSLLPQGLALEGSLNEDLGEMDWSEVEWVCEATLPDGASVRRQGLDQYTAEREVLVWTLQYLENNMGNQIEFGSSTNHFNTMCYRKWKRNPHYITTCFPDPFGNLKRSVVTTPDDKAFGFNLPPTPYGKRAAKRNAASLASWLLGTMKEN